MTLSPLLLATAALLAGPDPEFFTPRPSAVVIARDTIWFRATEWHDGSPVSTCYALATRSWCPVSRAAFPPPASPRLSARLRGLLGAASPARGDSATAWLVHRGTLWAAFPSFANEDEGRPGSLAAIDTVTGRVIHYRHWSFEHLRVADMAADDRTLWLGTVDSSEFGQYGGNGAVRVDLSGRAPTFAPVQPPSDTDRMKEVMRLAAAGGVVGIMAHDGVAVRLSDGRWDWRYWQLGLEGERIGHSLAASPQYNEEWHLLLATVNLRLSRPGSTVRAFRQRRVRFDNPDYLPADSVGRQLLATGLLPIVKETLVGTDSLHPAVLAAAGLSGDRTLVPLLKRRLGTRGNEAALALVRLGDPAGVAHFRQRLLSARRERSSDPDLNEVLGRTRSPLIVEAIRGLFADGISNLSINGEPQGLSSFVAADLLQSLDAMGTVEARAAARDIRRRFPHLRN